MNVIGRRFGMLVAIARHPGSKIECRCDCGNTKTFYIGHLNNGSFSSCGCHVVRHGHSPNHGKSREYTSYYNMIARCHKPSNKRFNDYGAKGITVCDRWRNSFVAFIEDMGPCPSGFTIDRKDNELGYFPENCRWVSRKENQANRSVSKIWVIDGKRFSTAQEAAEHFGLSTATIRSRCMGRTARGKSYPPRPGCSVEQVYGGAA